jgi:hypothetical protein
MMAKLNKSTAILTTILIIGAGLAAESQPRGTAATIETTKRLERQIDKFRRSLGSFFAADRSNAIAVEEDFMALSDSLEIASKRLRERAADGEVIKPDVEDVLSRGLRIEMMIAAHTIAPAARRDWARLKATLDRLANLHKVVWVWTVNQNPYWRSLSPRRVIDRLESRADEFRLSFENALEAGPLKGAGSEKNGLEMVKSFDRSTNRLEERLNAGEQITEREVESILRLAQTIDAFMRRHEFSPRSRRDWAQVRTVLDELALLNNVIWRWRYSTAAGID